MDSEPQPLAEPSAEPPFGAGPRAGREDNQAVPYGSAHTEGRSTDRPTHTPRGARNGDHPSRPGALPPAPGRLFRVLGRAAASSAVPVVAMVLLVLVSWQVVVDGPLLGLDRGVRHGVATARHDLHSSVLDQLGHVLADLGSTVPAIPVLLAAGGLVAWRFHQAGATRWWLPIPVAVLTAILIPLLVVPAKAAFARPGPLGDPLLPGQWGWYPSGHTATATLSYGVAVLLLARTAGVRVARRLQAVAVLLAAGVGAGLVWSDFHWLLDVVASWCLAALVLWALARWLPRPGAPGPQASGAAESQAPGAPGTQASGSSLR
ncbi:phosphatase PAP2 family protein [Kitasatospora aureofaciens]|uniref:phosphatase PAP2 family protein n=1 Tax=Kitasatospora aureofaciens TaxID=1894 RepID=UPI001C43A25D|nr:phosphatase PAP2 family protein [Kitasatospora aureofaciens]MBV6702169.1 phosphatase PAP2 family protein [Kitasatospora aureofaciens]